MNRVFYSLIFMFLAVGGIAVFQATRETSSLIVLPSELAAKKDAGMKRIRVAGRVADRPIAYTVQPLIELKFSIVNPPKYMDRPLPPSEPIAVEYRGIKPDMFGVGRDIIIDGDYANGTLIAQKLLTQCPSKYEPAGPDAHASEIPQ